MKLTWALAVLVAAATAATPTRIDSRATKICGQWDSVQTGSYTVYQDLWGMSTGTGSQCSTVNFLSNTSVLSWSTSWSWSGGSSQVKSFANVVASIPITQLSKITGLPSTWKWSYAGKSLVADVAYDLFTSFTASSSAASNYEVMIWLAALGGAGPISSTGSPIATVTLAGVSWKLYSGFNGAMHVFSFLPASGKSVTSFSGDLMAFLSYLVGSQGMPSTQYLQSIGAGTEPFTGSNAVFSVAAYSCAMSTGGSGGGGGRGPASTSTKPTATSGDGGSGLEAAQYAQCGGNGWTGPKVCMAPYSCQAQNTWYSQCL